MKNILNRKLIFLLIAISFSLSMHGCEWADTIVDQYQTGRGATIIDYFTNNEDLFLQCSSEIGSFLQQEKNAIYRIRPMSESRLQITKITGINGIDESYMESTCLSVLFSSNIVTMIEIYNEVISFHCDFFSVSKGVAFIPSGHPEDIREFNSELDFVSDGNGYLGTKEGSNTSFYYSWITGNWYYYEARY